MYAREFCFLFVCVFARAITVRFDFDVNFSIAWEIVKGLAFCAYQGRKLEDVAHYTDQIEAYAMQRMLENTCAYIYLLPFTLLISFLFDPLITIFFLLKAGEFDGSARVAAGWRI